MTVIYFDNPTIIRTKTTPVNRSVSGYGSKLPTNYMVLDGKIKRRVYAICYSNAVSLYVLIRGNRVFIRDCDFN